jgi:hypothetical protein
MEGSYSWILCKEINSTVYEQVDLRIIFSSLRQRERQRESRKVVYFRSRKNDNIVDNIAVVTVRIGNKASNL